MVGERMITTKLMGGMGNQMFQYMMGLQQSHVLKTKLQLDTSMLGGIRPFQLGQWRTPINLCTPQKTTIHEQGMPYNQATVDCIRDGDVLQGYWQSEKYFSNFEHTEVRKMFRPVGLPSERAKGLYNGLTDEGAVAVHVRRGDYLIEPHRSFHGVLGVDYYYKAMLHIKERVLNPMFFIFTDDPVWCRNEFIELEDVFVIEPGREAEDIHLMAHCKHAITANSSFSWWGSWLGEWQKNRIVVAPEKWFDQSKEDTRDIVPERWVKL
jgi:hypothetical protein